MRCQAALSAASAKVNRLEDELADALTRIAELEKERTSLEDRLAHAKERLVDLHYRFHAPFLPLTMRFDVEALCLQLGVRRPW